MSKDVRCWGLAALCGLAGVCCPLAIVWLGYTYGDNEAYRDGWPSYAVNWLFLADVFFMISMICLMRSWRWLGVLVAIPLLILTAILAILGGMWIEGTSF
jgi:hypothetical protein